MVQSISTIRVKENYKLTNTKWFIGKVSFADPSPYYKSLRYALTAVNQTFDI